MSRILALLALLAAALGAAGCFPPMPSMPGGTKTPEAVAEMTKRFQQIIAEMLGSTAAVDEQVRKTLERKPAVRFPARLGIVELSSLSPMEINAFAEKALELLAKQEHFAPKITVLHPWPVLCTPFPPSLRFLAAQVDPPVDLLLFTVFEWREKYDKVPVLFILDYTIIGALILPAHIPELEGRAAAFLFDVPSGKIVATAAAFQSDWTYCTAAGEQSAARNLYSPVARRIYEELVPQLDRDLQAFRRGKEETPPPAPKGTETGGKK